MKNFDKVSVIVPVYNAEKYLCKCVDSIVAQTYPNLEILLIDDGSTDKSPEICDEYQKRNKIIKVIHKKNGGVSSARNVGIEISTGKYVCFIDADDYVESNFIKALIDSCFCDCDLVISGMIYDFGKKKTKSSIEKDIAVSLYEFKNLFDKLYKMCLTNSPWAKLYNKNLLNGLAFDESVSLGEDLLFNYLYLNKCKNIFISQYSGYYYNRTNNYSATKKYSPEYMLCLTKCYEQSKIFKYGYIQNNNDIIDVTFCQNCIAQIQLAIGSSYDKDIVKREVKNILNNIYFEKVVQTNKLSKKYFIPGILCKRKKMNLIFLYFKIKLKIKKLIKK